MASRSEAEILALPTRRSIFEYVRLVPGEHLRGIERGVALPFGQVLYHLDFLERHGLVTARKDGGFKRYYVRAIVGRSEKTYIAAFRHDVPRRVGVLLLLAGGMTHRELATRSPVAGSTLSFHLAKMAQQGVLARELLGGEQRYRVADERIAAKVLVFYRESWQDPLVDRFADAWLEVNYVPAHERLDRILADRALSQRLRTVVNGPGDVATAVLGGGVVSEVEG
ncbi:MAG TPA: hypothetical protein VI997_00720 [Candidatus Thermoplasmatota archaeon]|nr:hypothetical protein [Candidatus Thermoplasmatota archaeon]